MNNIGFNISTVVTASFGIFGMENNQFSPYTAFFYFIGIIIICFLMGFFGEQVQMFINKSWWKYKHKNRKWDGIGQ